MNKEILKKGLLELLRGPFEEYGFILNKGLAEFTKNQKGGWDKFQLVFLNRKAGWEINLGMLIRKDIIENLYHQASYFEPKYHKSTPSLGISIENFIDDGTEHRCYLNSEGDLEKCADDIKSLFVKVALPFFEKYNDLKTMDKVINLKNGTSIFSGLKYGGNLGIILAKLVHNPDYDFFLKKYLEYYKTFSEGFYLPEYEKLVKVLDGI